MGTAMQLSNQIKYDTRLRESVCIYEDYRREGVRDDRQFEGTVLKRHRQQEKHTKIAWQQQCHKIQGLVLSFSESERRGGGREPGATCVCVKESERQGCGVAAV